MSDAYIRYPQSGGGGSGTVTSIGVAAPASILTVSGSPVTTSGIITLGLQTQTANTVWAGPTTGSAATPTFRALVTADIPTANLTAAGTDGIVVTAGTGAVLGSGTSLAQHISDATHNGYLSSTDWVAFNAKQTAGNYITALTGDATASGPGSVVLTLATVNSNVGAFGSSTAIPTVTVNAKGLVTAVSTNVVIAPAGTLTGTTLAANVVTSSLTTVGTVGTGTWQGSVITPVYGGTGVANNAASTIAVSGNFGTTLTVSATTTATLQPTTGVIVGRTTSDVLTNKTFDVASNTFTGKAPTLQKFTSGSGTYTRPSAPAPLYIRVRLAGGGGGGAGSGSATPGNGGNGGDTTFGTTLLVGSAGTGATGGATSGAAGGAGSLGSGPVGLAFTGASGGGPGVPGGVAGDFQGGNGGQTPFGGGGSMGGAAAAGGAAQTNTGSGGGGGGGNNVSASGGGAGGGAGGFVDAIITSPSTTYSYAVGAAGTNGSAGTNGNAGGAGAAGIIEVTEFYQ